MDFTEFDHLLGVHLDGGSCEEGEEVGGLGEDRGELELG
jgi:hypothetical protein